MELEEIDLNLLVVFKHLLAERSVSRVAEVLGLTQPAVSNALARLRKLMDDELFLRTPAGMEPTPFAEQLAESVTYGLGMIHGALNQRASFEAQTSTRPFVIGMTDIGETYFLPRLMERLRRDAPGVTVSTVRTTAVHLRDDMEAGKVDLAIGLLPQLKAGFFQRRLFQQRYVCIFRKGHPLDKRKMTLREFSAAEHLLVVSEGTGHGKVDEVLKRSGVERKISLTVPHFVALGHILQATDLVATVPERFAQRMTEPFDLVYLPHPAALPEVAINVFWHAKFHKAPANQWLRGLVFEMFSD
jgi:DNA-binding transcriptional LysR family regulator